MANPNTTSDSSQYIKNKSFDPTFGVSMVEAVGYDGSVLRPIAVDATGQVKLDPTNLFDQTAADALYLKLTAANQTVTGNLAITGTLKATTLFAGDVASGEYASLSLGGVSYAPGLELYTDGNWSQSAGRVGVVSYDDAADTLLTYSDSIGGAIGLYGTGGLDQGLGLGYYDGGLYSSTLVLPWNSGAWGEVDIYGKFAVTDTITGNSSIQLLDTAGLILKGATYKITLKGTTATSDKIITIPNLAGTMALTGVAQNWATSGTLASGDITLTGTKLKIIGAKTSGMAVTDAGGGTIQDYGVNYDQLGGRDATAPGGLFRIDTRTGYYLPEFFTIIYRPAGSTENVIFKCSTTGDTVNKSSTLSNLAAGVNESLRFAYQDALNAGASISWWAGNTTKTAAITHNLAGADAAGGYLAFSTYYSSLTEKLRIQGDGKVGIGLTAPLALLHIDTSTTIGTEAFQIQQDDADKSFINYQGTSAANQANNISTVQGDGIVSGPQLKVASAGWVYAGMVKTEVNGAEFWMPYYSTQP